MSTPTLTKVPPGSTAPAEAGTPAPARSRRKLLLVVALPLVLALLAAGWFFLLRGGGEEAAPPPPEKGEVLRMDPISINLADGHYLKLGVALQVVAEPSGHELDGAQALDLAISTFSGREIAELSTPEARETLKGDLLTRVEEVYHHDVMDIYFTDFVMQ